MSESQQHSSRRRGRHPRRCRFLRRALRALGPRMLLLLIALSLSFGMIRAVEGGGSDELGRSAGRSPGRLSSRDFARGPGAEDGASPFLRPDSHRQAWRIGSGEVVTEADLRALLSASVSTAEPQARGRAQAELSADLRFGALSHRSRRPLARDAVPEPEPLLLLALGLLLMGAARERSRGPHPRG